jgi:hypothetical protein
VKHTPQAAEALKSHRARRNEERLQLGSLLEDRGLVFPNRIGKRMNADNLYHRGLKPLLERRGSPASPSTPCGTLAQRCCCRRTSTPRSSQWAIYAISVKLATAAMSPRLPTENRTFARCLQDFHGRARQDSNLRPSDS